MLVKGNGTSLQKILGTEKLRYLVAFQGPTLFYKDTVSTILGKVSQVNDA